MNTEQLLVLIATILIFIIVIITVVLIIINFNNYPLNKLEPFLGCITHRGKISSLDSDRVFHNNMNNTGRLNELKLGPVPNFHQQFTGGLAPELKWRSSIEKQMNNLTEVTGINGELIQEINPVDNVYSTVDY